MLKVILSNSKRNAQERGYFQKLEANIKREYGVHDVCQFGPKSIEHCNWLRLIIKNDSSTYSGKFSIKIKLSRSVCKFLILKYLNNQMKQSLRTLMKIS
jgi:hypothetical protein